MRFFIATLVFILSSCSLPGTQTESTDNTVLYENTVFQMQVPKTWTEAKKQDIPAPRHGNILLAFVSPEVKYGFSNNLIVMQDSLSSIITSKRYAELNAIQTSKNYLEYTKLQDQEFIFSDKEVSRLYVFEARYNQTSPRMKFVQTARVCGSEVYLLHFSLALDKSPDIYTELLKTFVCK